MYWKYVFRLLSEYVSVYRVTCTHLSHRCFWYYFYVSFFGDCL